MNQVTKLREALEAEREWLEAQRKVISKGCGSPWDMMQVSERVSLIDAALTADASDQAPTTPYGPVLCYQCFADDLASTEPVDEVPAAERAEEDEFVIRTLGKLLAEIASVVKGEEAPRHPRSYHDLPEAVKVMAIELDLYRTIYGTTVPKGWEDGAAPDRAPSTDSATEECLRREVAELTQECQALSRLNSALDEKLAELDSATERDARLTLQCMADCMDMVRGELIEAGIIDKSVPPMMISNAVLARIGAAERDARWLEVDGARKPAVGEMVLLHVRTSTRAFLGDEEVEGVGSEIALGEYRAGEFKDDPEFFDCYTSPMSDNDWITHWMPLPAKPAIAAMKGEA